MLGDFLDGVFLGLCFREGWGFFLEEITGVLGTRARRAPTRRNSSPPSFVFYFWVLFVGFFFVEVWIGWVCGIFWGDVVGKFEITWGLLDQEWFLVGGEGIFFGDFKKSSWNFWGDIFLSREESSGVVFKR